MEQRIPVGDIDINCDISGSGPRTIVLIPGLSLDFVIWREVAASLAGSHRVIVVEPRGSGKSDVPRGPYTVNLMAGDVYGLLMSLQVDRAVVVGHSMGGYIALQLALDNPDLVAGLGLVCTSPVGMPQLMGISDSAKRAQRTVKGNIIDIVNDNMMVSVGSSALVERREALEQFAAHRIAHPPRGRGVTAQREAADAFDVRGRLWEITCKTLVIHGSEDEVIPPARGEDLAAGIDNAILELLEDVGHLPSLEKPEKLSALLDSFMMK